MLTRGRGVFSLISISICSNLVHTGIDMVYCSTRAISLSPVTNGGHAGYVHLSSIKYALRFYYSKLMPMDPSHFLHPLYIARFTTGV